MSARLTEAGVYRSSGLDCSVVESEASQVGNRPCSSKLSAVNVARTAQTVPGLTAPSAVGVTLRGDNEVRHRRRSMTSAMALCEAPRRKACQERPRA
jgi:hypothetical protein